MIYAGLADNYPLPRLGQLTDCFYTWDAFDLLHEIMCGPHFRAADVRFRVFAEGFQGRGWTMIPDDQGY